MIGVVFVVVRDIRKQRERAEGGLYLLAWAINLSFALNFDCVFLNQNQGAILASTK